MDSTNMAGPFSQRNEHSVLYPSVDASNMTMAEHLVTVRDRAKAAMRYDDDGDHVLEVISRSLMEHRESMFLNSKCLLMMNAISANEIRNKSDIWEWIEQFQPLPPPAADCFMASAVD